MDSLKDILNKIHKFEQEYDVNSLRFNRVHAWPLFRKAIWTDFMKKNIVSNVKQKNVDKGVPKFSRNKLIKRYQLIKRKRKLVKQLNEIKKKYKFDSEILLYSSVGYLTDNIEGKLYDRHIDPIKEFIYTGANKFVAQENPANTKFEASSLRLDLLEELMEVEAHLGLMPKQSLEGETAIFDHFEEVFSIEVTQFTYRFNRILYLADYLRDILGTSNVKAVFLPCWYDDYSLSLISACRSLNIKTVDVQHGKQGKYHAMYTHFTKIPEKGYHFLPDYFWNWGEEYAENIAKWMSNEAHKTVVIGNLWTAIWKEEIFQHRSPELKILESKMDDFESRVIVSLQPIHDTIPDWLRNAVKEMPNTFFAFRPHPKQKEDEELKKNVISLGENTDWDLCSNLPLYPLLQLFECHLTPWSSVAFEAKLMGLKNGIIHLQGVEMYAEEIRNEVFTSVQSKNELKSFVTAGEQTPYEGMVCNLEQIKSNVKSASWN